MEVKMNLTLDEMQVISVALKNDARVYRDAANEQIEIKDFFYDYMDSYRERMVLSKKFDRLYDANLYKLDD